MKAHSQGSNSAVALMLSMMLIGGCELGKQRSAEVAQLRTELMVVSIERDRLQKEIDSYKKLLDSMQTALEGANKAGMVPISNHVGNFLDLHISCGEQVRRHGEPALTKQFADVYSCFLFEQSLQVGGTEMHLISQLAHRARKARFD